MITKKNIILLFILVLIFISAPIAIIVSGRASDGAEAERMTVLKLWQIDSFEGGKGSRAQYLQDKAKKFFANEKIYVTVSSLSADAARENISDGNLPDMISYGAGFYGIENKINATDFIYKCWCRGGYCILTLEPNADFKDISKENTVVNAGKENLAGVAAALSGLGEALTEKPTSAYLKLLNGQYKYLFGTQRDVCRLNVRGASYCIKPITVFNDLYQNISILTRDGAKYEKCKRYVDRLLENNSDSDKIGMLADGKKLYDGEAGKLENLNFTYTVRGICGKSYVEQLKKSAAEQNLNMLKSLLK